MVDIYQSIYQTISSPGIHTSTSAYIYHAVLQHKVYTRASTFRVHAGGQLHARQQSAAPRCMRASASTITQIVAKLTHSLQEYFAVTISFFNTVPAGVTCSSRSQLALHSTFFNTASTHRLQYLHAGSV